MGMSVSKSNIATIVLVITLIASNGLWAYASMSDKTTAREMHATCEQNKPSVDAHYDAILPRLKSQLPHRLLHKQAATASFVRLLHRIILTG